MVLILPHIHVELTRLSQFNFYDHSKLILSSHGLLITHIDKNYRMTRWTLTDVMDLAMQSNLDAEPESLKFNQRLVDKLKYCKEVLVSIRTASASGLAVPEENDTMGAELITSTATPPGGAINAKASKAFLR